MGLRRTALPRSLFLSSLKAGTGSGNGSGGLLLEEKETLCRMWTAVDLLGARDWHGALTDLLRFALVPLELLVDDSCGEYL